MIFAHRNWLTLFLAAALFAGERIEMCQAAVNASKDVGIDQRLDAQLPLDLSFLDESGRPVHLRDYFDSRPVVLVFAYYRCPMLCTQVLNGLVKSMREIDLEL